MLQFFQLFPSPATPPFIPHDLVIKHSLLWPWKFPSCLSEFESLSAELWLTASKPFPNTLSHVHFPGASAPRWLKPSPGATPAWHQARTSFWTRTINPSIGLDGCECVTEHQCTRSMCSWQQPKRAHESLIFSSLGLSWQIVKTPGQSLMCVTICDARFPFYSFWLN